MPTTSPTSAEVAALLKLAMDHREDAEVKACLEALLNWLERQTFETRPKPTRPPSQWLSRGEAAEYLKLASGTLRNLATLGKGPKMKKTSAHHVLYHINDLDEWIANNGVVKRRR